MKYLPKIFFLVIALNFTRANSQEIELFQQFNGNYDFTAIGNTLNPAENNLVQNFCEILPSSSADLNLGEDATIVKAFLYWAGSGEGDTQVSLNSQTIDAEVTYNVDFQFGSNTLVYFSCFADVTELVSNLGNTTYELSNLDISDVLAQTNAYCENRTNFAGWSIHVIYEDLNLPINQINVFQGLDIINTTVQEKTIELTNLNVLDTLGAKIGFLAWEGDNALNYGESLSINDAILSNPPLNLPDNAFNGTNTYTNSSDLYNMDLDVYDIENIIDIGDTSATIKLTTGGFDDEGEFQADLIILNTIVTVLNSQLPDATIELTNIQTPCASQTITIDFTVGNIVATDPLPANTPIAFYIDNILVAAAETINELDIGETESQTITITLPSFYIGNFDLVAIVDDDGTGNGTVSEINETNNGSVINFTIEEPPQPTALSNLLGCDLGFNTAEFDLTQVFEINNIENVNATFYENIEDMYSQENAILNPENYTNTQNSQTIYLRVEIDDCFEFFTFKLEVENCPPVIPQGFSPNNDNYNDWFNIQGLYNVFDKHQLLIYNRYGSLIFEGNNNTKWEGIANRGLLKTNTILPTGTYYYILYLNDPKFKTQVGWVYLNRK